MWHSQYVADMIGPESSIRKQDSEWRKATLDSNDSRSTLLRIHDRRSWNVHSTIWGLAGLLPPSPIIWARFFIVGTCMTPPAEPTFAVPQYLIIFRVFDHLCIWLLTLIEWSSPFLSTTFWIWFALGLLFRTDKLMFVLPHPAISVGVVAFIAVNDATRDIPPTSPRADEMPSSGFVDLASDKHVTWSETDSTWFTMTWHWGRRGMIGLVHE